MIDDVTTTRFPKRALLASALGAGALIGGEAAVGNALSSVFAQIGLLGFVSVGFAILLRWVALRLEADDRRRSAEWSERIHEHSREIERRDQMLDRLTESLVEQGKVLVRISSTLDHVSHSLDRLDARLSELKGEVDELKSTIHPSILRPDVS